MTHDTAFLVEQEVYSGPFDLLLQAIDNGELDAQRVSLSQITAAYFEYWKKEEPPLVLASDFLIMAAYLLELKTRLLLPAREEPLAEQAVEEIEESLVSHIQEYEVYKGLARTLRQRKEIFERVYGRHEGEPQEKEFELVDLSLQDLLLAFKRVYDEAAKRERVVPIVAEEVKLEDRVNDIRRLVQGKREGVQFIDIFLRKTRLEIVVTFLAVLELAKQRFLRVAQDRRYGSIILFDREVWEEQHGNIDHGTDGPTDHGQQPA